MNEKQFIYRVTVKGRSLSDQGLTLPAPLDYSSILAVLDRSGDPLVVRSYLAGYLAHVVDGWLAQLETDGLIERVAAPAREPATPALASARAALEGAALDDEISFADLSLSRLGVYVSNERVAQRQPTRKPAGETIAIVLEDDPDQLALAKLRLVTAGYTVVGADSVQAFYRRLQGTTPDVAFLDVNLPDGDGFEVLAALRQDPTYAELPIVMVTVRSEPQDIARGLALGADGYVTKPYGRNTLEYVVRYVIKQEIQPLAAA